MKKVLLLSVISILIVPSITFAAWWNPASWFRKANVVPIKVLEVQPSDDHLDKPPVVVNPSVQPKDKTVSSVVKHSATQNVVKPSKPAALNLPSAVAQTVQCASGATNCAGKCWLPCLNGQSFVCGSDGAICVTPSQPIAQSSTEPISRQAEIKSELKSVIDKWNNGYSEYLKEQQDIDQRVKPLNDEFQAVLKEEEEHCPAGEFQQGQKASECRDFTARLNDINRKISEVTGIYPKSSSLPSYSLPAPERWIIDTVPGGVNGKIWSPDTAQKYEYTCSQYSCDVRSY